MAITGCYHQVVPKTPRLKAVRESKYLSQRELAEKAGVTPVTVSRLEKGDGVGSNASLPMVRRLAEALGVEPGELVQEGDEKG